MCSSTHVVTSMRFFGRLDTSSCPAILSMCWAHFLQHTFMDIFDAHGVQVYEGLLEQKVTPDEESADRGSGDIDMVWTHEGSTDGKTSMIDGTGMRLAQRQSDVISGGRQCARRRPEQLVADGLSPEVHLRVALSLDHPYCSVVPSTESVRRAPAGHLPG